MKSAESALPATQVDTLLTRKVVGKRLFQLLDGFGVITDHEAVCLPLDEAGELDPRAEVVKDRHLHGNSQALWPLELTTENLVPKLTEHLPKLAQPITRAVANSVAWTHNKSGAQFLSLCLDPDTTERLSEEQAAIWNILPEISGMDAQSEPLRWKPYEPRVLVIAFGADIPQSPVARTRNYILRNAPFEVTLLPLGEDRD